MDAGALQTRPQFWTLAGSRSAHDACDRDSQANPRSLRAARLDDPAAHKPFAHLPAQVPHRLASGQGHRPTPVGGRVDAVAVVAASARGADPAAHAADAAQEALCDPLQRRRDAEQIGAVLPQHLEYMIGLEKTGVLFALRPAHRRRRRAGRRRADHPARRRARTRRAKIASADPFVVNKLRSFEVREWTVMEGSLGVKVNFSDQSLEIA